MYASVSVKIPHLNTVSVHTIFWYWNSRTFQGPWSCIFKDQFWTEVYSIGHYYSLTWLDSSHVHVNVLGHTLTPFLSVESCHLRSSQVSPIPRRSFLTIPLQFVLGQPLLKPGTSQYSAITAIFNIYFCAYGTVLVDKNKTWQILATLVLDKTPVLKSCWYLTVWLGEFKHFQAPVLF